MRTRRSSGPRLCTPLAVSVALSAALPASLLLWGGYGRRWAGDDGFINLRVVRQLLAGNGFVINAGERVEAVTSAAWVFVLWALGALGFDLESAAWVTSLGLSALGAAMSVLATVRLLPKRSPRTLVLPFGVLAYVAIPVAWDYSTSALENGLGLAFLGTGYWLVGSIVVNAIDASKARWAALFIGIAPLVRPDFVFYAAPLGLVLLGAAHRDQRAMVAVCGALPGLSFQLFRMGYFAALVPNTAIAKEAFAARWDQGLLFLKNTVSSYGLVTPLLLAFIVLVPTVVAAATRRDYLRALLMGGMALAGAAQILYVVRVGGDFMHGRMLLPGLFAIFSSMGALTVDLEDHLDVAHKLVAVAAMAVWAFVCASWLRVVGWENDILDEREWYATTSKVANPVQLEDYVNHPFYNWGRIIRAGVAAGCPHGDASLMAGSRDVCKRLAYPDGADGGLTDQPPGAAMAINPAMVGPTVMGILSFRPIGISGNVLGPRISVVDSYGLADPLASRMELAARGRAGHEKVFPVVWYAAKYAAKAATSDPAVALARSALECGALKELHEATHAPLSWSRFWRNVRQSFRLHRLRVTADPARAERRFCKKR